MLIHTLFILCFISFLPNLNQKGPVWFFGLITFFMFFSVRNGFGTDFSSYKDAYFSASYGRAYWGESDLVFSFLIESSPNFTFFIFITTFLLFLSITLVLTELKRGQRFLFFFLYFINPHVFLMLLSGIRQALAITLVNFCAYLILRSRIRLALIPASLSILAHKSSVAFLIASGLSFLNIKISKVRLFFSVVLIFLSGFFFFDIFKLTLMSIDVTKAYAHYLENPEKGSVVALLYNFFTVAVIYKGWNRRRDYFYNLAFLGVLTKIFSFHVLMLNRVAMYLDIFIIVALCISLSHLRTSLIRVSVLCLLVFAQLYRYIDFFSNSFWIHFHSLKIGF